MNVSPLGQAELALGLHGAQLWKLPGSNKPQQNGSRSRQSWRNEPICSGSATNGSRAQQTAPTYKQEVTGSSPVPPYRHIPGKADFRLFGWALPTGTAAWRPSEIRPLADYACLMPLS
jgi:hypothetical protein